jgi:predicted PolB exonuclease-like 3'-5' exonuclease
MNVVIDIETIPCDVDTRKSLPPITPPATCKNESKIRKWCEENLANLEEEQYRKTALDANLGHVFCIGMLFFTEKSDSYAGISIYGQQEKLMLSEFWKRIGQRKSPRIITHNGLHFDLPFIWKRSVILQVKPTMQFNLIRYRTDYVYDTMAVWSNWDLRNSIKLDELAKTLGVGKKSGTGEDVYNLWRGGKYRDIAEYCFQDVYLTYCCYCRMNFIIPIERAEISVDYIEVD